MQRDDRNPSNKPNLLLVTCYDNNNHGNRLQHYAMQELLKSLGFNVDSLCCSNIPALPSGIMYDMKIMRRHFLASLGIKRYKNFFRKRDNYKNRFKRFEDFSDKYIESKIITDFKEVLKSNNHRWDKYFKVVVGSDQVWNINVVRETRMLEYFYLSFVERKKRVNYAPSFGYNSVQNEHFEIHKNGLLGFDRLSCREKNGCALIKNITGLDAELVLDPTLMLSTDQWRSISHKPSYPIPEHYVLTYFLASKSDDEIEAIKDIAGSLEIIEIHDDNDILHYLTSPQEFLWLIDHADFICTDSFHGTAFSINFKKNFISFGNSKGNPLQDTFGRIESLLSICDLSDRVYNAEKYFSKKFHTEIDYSNVDKKLESIKYTSMEYLRKCLNIK